jgi:drug/metabolite transporter (DMT)-like permease
VYTRRFLSPLGLAPLAVAAAQVLAAVCVQALLTPLFPWRTPELTSAVVGSIVALGLLSTGLAYVLFFGLVGDVGATSASAVNYVVPVFAVLLSVVLLAENRLPAPGAGT